MTVHVAFDGRISHDGRTLTYHLRHNAAWHDGVPFTSADVAFSYRAIINPANNVASRHAYDLIASVATPDRYTVISRMKRPYGPAVTTPTVWAGGHDALQRYGTGRHFARTPARP